MNHSQRQKQRRIPKWSQLIKTPVPAAAAVSKTAVCPTGAVSIPEYDMEDVEELAPEEAALETGRLLKQSNPAGVYAAINRCPCPEAIWNCCYSRPVYGHCQEYTGMPFYFCAGRAWSVQVHDMGRNRTDPQQSGPRPGRTLPEFLQCPSGRPPG